MQEKQKMLLLRLKLMNNNRMKDQAEVRVVEEEAAVEDAASELAEESVEAYDADEAESTDTALEPEADE
jgi:hypothetical protein